MTHTRPVPTVSRPNSELPTVRVALAEDHPLFCRAIQDTLQKYLGWSVTSCSETGEDALRAVEWDRPDLLILDLQLKGSMDGYAVLRHIRTKELPVKVFVLTAHCDRESFLHEANTPDGPDGILEKDADSHELLSALTEVMQGRKFLPSKLIEIHKENRGEADGHISALTPRELAVLAILAKGCTYKEIAGQLRIHEQTVRNHMQTIYEKLDLERRTPQAAVAAYFGYLESSDKIPRS